MSEPESRSASAMVSRGPSPGTDSARPARALALLARAAWDRRQAALRTVADVIIRAGPFLPPAGRGPIRVDCGQWVTIIMMMIMIPSSTRDSPAQAELMK
jgi:hypothetical protein